MIEQEPEVSEHDEELEQLRREHEKLCEQMENGNSKALKVGLIKRVQTDPKLRRKLLEEAGP